MGSKGVPPSREEVDGTHNTYPPLGKCHHRLQGELRAKLAVVTHDHNDQEDYSYAGESHLEGSKNVSTLSTKPLIGEEVATIMRNEKKFLTSRLKILAEDDSEID